MQRDVREVVCDNTLEHTKEYTGKIVDGLMPNGWKHMAFLNGESKPIEFDACSPGCAAAIAASIIRYQIYEMKE